MTSALKRSFLRRWNEDKIAAPLAVADRSRRSCERHCPQADNIHFKNSLMKGVFRMILVTAASLLSACAGLGQALDDQRHALQGVRTPAKSAPVVVKRTLNLEFRRGVIETRFLARLPSGTYRPVAETDTGVFHIAPEGAFAYATNGRVESVVGGLFIPSAGKNAQVWLWPLARNRDYWQPVAEGLWIDHVRVGIRGIAERPWVERGFAVPADALK